MKTFANILAAAAYVRTETIISGIQAAQLDSLTASAENLSKIIERNTAKIADRVANGQNVAMLERMTEHYKAQFADVINTLRVWLIDFKANRPNVQIEL